jgi:membrane fusion protein, copper/silver efflux system
MKRSVFILTLVGCLLLGLGMAGGYWFATHQSKSSAKIPVTQNARSGAAGSSQVQQTQSAVSKTDRKVLYWHDPMVPGPKFDKPGKSPFMDMQLMPVYADEAADEAKVHISPRTVQNLGVRFAEVKQGSVDHGFSAVGAITVDERSITTVQSRVNGYIEKLHVRAQYDSVARGQQLAQIYAPDWLSAQGEYLALKQSRQPGAEMLAEAARERLRLLGISDEQIQTVERDGKPNPRVTLYAPQGGVVWELGARDGMAVSPGMTLFKLASLRTVWVNAEIPELQAELAKPGGSVEARVAAVNGKVFKGRIAMLLPDVNATTRTIKARIVLNNSGGELKPGMFATLTLGGRQQSTLLVPTEAVISTGTRNVVIVADSEGKFLPVDVTLGRESGDMTEIRKGVSAGQRVVVSGQFLIDSEASLKATLGRMNEAVIAPAPRTTSDHADPGAEGGKP